ncbi:hypothetical protein ACT436_06470 [Acinetobacter baumannii]
MKPGQFIREFGVEKAREALTLCCWMDGSFCTRLWHGCVQNNHECCVDVKELKHLVESLEIIETVGYDRDGAEEIYEFSKDCEVIHYAGLEIKVARLAQAIRDHESIYGGGE